jgi:predicted MFS family arabinose efflux permease
MDRVEPALSRSPFWPISAGMCATMVGIGLQRFAYAPLLPAIVQAGLLSGGAAGALGAVNLGGYLFGAALAPAVGRAVGLRWALRGAMLAAVIGFLLCAVPGGFAWLTPWRILTGFAGGVLMVLAGPAVQLVVPAGMRGLAAGLVFAGVGSGIVIGAVLIPVMVPQGLPAAWLSLAALAAGLTALSWRFWPDVPAPRKMRLPRLRGPEGRLVLAYAGAAVAQTAHMVWWPDFIARGLGQGTEAGANYWILYGITGACGPALWGRLGDRFGAAPMLRAAMAVQAVALALPLLDTSMPMLLLSTVCGGATAIGLTALTLTRARDLAGDAASGVWRVSTATFGLSQTLTGFLMAWLYGATHGHAALFAVGLVGAVSGLLLSGW